MNITKKIFFLIYSVFTFHFCFVNAGWAKLGKKQFKTVSLTRSYNKKVTAIGLDNFVYKWKETSRQWEPLCYEQFKSLSFPWALDFDDNLWEWGGYNWVKINTNKFKSIYYPMAIDIDGLVYIYIKNQLYPITRGSQTKFSKIFTSVSPVSTGMFYYFALTSEGKAYELYGQNTWIEKNASCNFEKILSHFGLGLDKKIYMIGNLEPQQVGDFEFKDLYVGQNGIWALGVDNKLYKFDNSNWIKTSDHLFAAVFDHLALDTNGYIYEWNEGEQSECCLLL